MKIIFRCLPELEGIIPRPFPAKKGLPGWLKKMPMTVFSEDWEKKMPTVKQCPPFVDVMSYGFMIPLPCDIRVEEGKFECDWDGMPLTVSGRHTPRSPLGVHPMDQATGTPIYDKDSIVIKFMTQWIIELEPGYSLLTTHPFNRPDLPFLTLTGLVDSDLYKDNYLNYPALWTDKDFSGVFLVTSICRLTEAFRLELVIGL